MPANLADLMGIGSPPGPGQTTGPGMPVPGSMPGVTPPGAATPGAGDLSSMMRSMGAGGMRSMVASLTAMLIKVLQQIGVAFDIDSAEGKAVNSAIKSLSKISKGQQTGNMQSIVQSLVSSLPPNYQNINPGSLTQAFTDILGRGGAPAGPTPGPGLGAMPPRPGATPTPGPMSRLMG